ncbi:MULTISPECIES: metal ABC transporter ATP-binding protein [Helicobacter]|uniref:Metal ABC transporter ATP-binding protein n=1 Tax=Helicobacter ibis TaxID=2962633 RepID=A0ABT4VDI3_9HELI|nr:MULTISPECIES: metal ABC transporter ATP-binding protein [Helicobacter]MDA3966616.1 metal ABC transporter ATP-binding protein [Helicobacter sp. WB40]MDA3968769.1 metal ABC transporter ATP-binding protein [Helicobacter ibis]
MNEQNKIIECKNVNFYLTKEHILYNVNWTINKGDFWAIIGPNGGGKSTLAKLLVNLLKPSSGEIIRDSKLKIGYVPQNTFFNRHFPVTAKEVVMMGFLDKESSLNMFSYTKTQKDKANKYIKELDLESHANKKIGELSGGLRQRVLIARALCSKPDILILDEPTSSIDKKHQKDIYEILKQNNKDKTIVIISHDISILYGYAKNALYVNKEVTIHKLPQINQNQNGKHFCEIEMMMGEQYE